MPIIYDDPLLSFNSGSKKLNKNTPIVIKMPMSSFVGPNLRLFYFTLEHKIATNKTESKLQDLNAIHIGKLVIATAHV